jgi:hypothetical protein
MYDVAIVQVFHRPAGLDEEAPDLGHAEKLAPLQRVGQRAVVADLQHNVRALFERESAEELDDIGVSQFGVQLKLGYELETSAPEHLAAAAYFLSQLLGLHLRLDNLQCDRLPDGRIVDALLCAIANGKAAFAQLVGGLILDSIGFMDHGRGRVGV